MRISASHPAGLHGRLAEKMVNHPMTLIPSDLWNRPMDSIWEFRYLEVGNLACVEPRPMANNNNHRSISRVDRLSISSSVSCMKLLLDFIRFFGTVWPCSGCLVRSLVLTLSLCCNTSHYTTQLWTSCDGATGIIQHWINFVCMRWSFPQWAFIFRS